MGFVDPAGRAKAVAANAAVLEDIAARGVDLGLSRQVNFTHIFMDLESARAFADEAMREGYAVETKPFTDEEFSWDVQASRMMNPTAEMITTVEFDLNYLATMCGGRADGWGFYSPGPTPSETIQD